MKKSNLKKLGGVLLILLVISTGCNKKENEITSYDKNSNNVIQENGNNNADENNSTNTENESSVNNSTVNTNIEKKDSKYFDEYLKVFTGCNGEKVTRNTTKFNDSDISNFVIYYVWMNADKNNTSGDYVEEMSVSEVDALVYKYFNTKDYKLSSQDSVTKITKDGNNYKFEWSAVGCGYTSYNNPVVTYNGENVTVKYDLSDARDKKQIGTETFHLKYNNGNYNLIKIEK